MRDIIEVLDNVIGVVPDYEHDFKDYLKGLKEDCLYTAPEAMQQRWFAFGGYVSRFIPYPPTEDWQKQAVKYFTGKEWDAV